MRAAMAFGLRTEHLTRSVSGNFSSTVERTINKHRHVVTERPLPRLALGGPVPAPLLLPSVGGTRVQRHDTSEWRVETIVAACRAFRLRSDSDDDPRGERSRVRETNSIHCAPGAGTGDRDGAG
jgi:hypothetical protein